MKPESLTKMLIHDDEGAAIAYTRDGIVYDLVSGARIAKLQAGRIYSLDGQFLGTACLQERFAEQRESRRLF